MTGAGHILDMKKRSDQNHSLLLSQKEKFGEGLFLTKPPQPSESVGISPCSSEQEQRLANQKAEKLSRQMARTERVLIALNILACALLCYWLLA